MACLRLARTTRTKRSIDRSPGNAVEQRDEPRVHVCVGHIDERPKNHEARDRENQDRNRTGWSFRSRRKASDTRADMKTYCHDAARHD